jgi:hypothetical protein
MSQNLKRQLEDLEQGSPPLKKAHIMSEEEFYSARGSPSTRNPTAHQSTEPSPVANNTESSETKDANPRVLDFEDKSQGQVTGTCIETEEVKKNESSEEGLVKTQEIPEDQETPLEATGTQVIETTEQAKTELEASSEAITNSAEKPTNEISEAAKAENLEEPEDKVEESC